MKDTLQNIIDILKADVTLAGLMNTSNPIPSTKLGTGTFDYVKETQASLAFPTIEIHTISETYRTVPLNAKDSRIQIDIWSRNSELEALNIYERVATLLNFTSGDKNSTHLFWERGDSLNTEYSSEVRLWRYSFDLILWSL